jgi:hypothetical protein
LRHQILPQLQFGAFRAKPCELCGRAAKELIQFTIKYCFYCQSAGFEIAGEKRIICWSGNQIAGKNSRWLGHAGASGAQLTPRSGSWMTTYFKDD